MEYLIAIIVMMILVLMYFVNQEFVRIHKKLNTVINHHNSLAESIHVSNEKTLFMDKILYIENGKIYFNSQRLICKNAIPVSPIALCEDIQLKLIRYYRAESALEIMLNGDAVAQMHLLISASFYGTGVPYIHSKANAYFTKECVDKCIIYYQIMMPVMPQVVYNDENRSAVNHNQCIAYKQSDLTNMSFVARDLLEFYFSYVVRPNIIQLFASMLSSPDLSEVRACLGKAIYNDINALKMIMSIASIRYGVGLPLSFFNLSKQAYDIYEKKINISNSLKVIK